MAKHRVNIVDHDSVLLAIAAYILILSYNIYPSVLEHELCIIAFMFVAYFFLFYCLVFLIML